MRIFISYKRQDEDLARQVHAQLEKWQYDVWLDVVDIRAGEDWDAEIHKGMREADIVIGFLTPESIASDNVLDEWGYAMSTGKRLFLLWVRDIAEIDVPPRYIRLQRIDVRTDLDDGLRRLRTALDSQSKIVPDATPEPQSAPAKQSEEKRSAPVASNMQMQTNRQRMLQKVKTFWIDGVLEQSVHGVAHIELGIERDQEKVENPWGTVLKHQSYGDYQLPSSASIADIFKELGNEILILGDPGSGKTTTLLTLARDMIERAESDPLSPVPVVFNLSSWADERKPLTDWLVDELNTKYQVPRPTGQEWVDNDVLLLLLDGLDEVDGRFRDQCVLAINIFRETHGFTQLAVCSRIIDYEALSNRLKLNGAIVLQPLADEQIDRYLESLGDKMSGVRAAMRDDDSLRTLAETPLMLSIMTLAFYGMTEEDLPELDNVDAQRERLFETYIQRMYERHPDGEYSRSDTLHYLRWLAGRMVERKQSVFYLENLQPDWIPGDRAQQFFQIFGRMAYGFLGGLFVGIIISLAYLFVMLPSVDGETVTIESVQSLALLLGGSSVTIGMSIFALAGLLTAAMRSVPLPIKLDRTLLRYVGRIFMSGMILALVIGLVQSLVYITSEVMLTGISNYTTWRTDATGLAVVLQDFFYSLMSFTFLGSIAASATPVLGIFATYGNTTDGAHKTDRKTGFLLFFASVVLVTTLSVLGYIITFGLADDFEYVWEFIPSLASSIALAVTFAVILLRIGRRFGEQLPYMVIGASVPFWFGSLFLSSEIGYAINNFNAQDTIYYLYEELAISGIFTLIASVVGALVGILVARITGNIVSAEALRWRWNWSWTLIGVVAGLGLAGFLIYDNFSETPLMMSSDFMQTQTAVNPVTGAEQDMRVTDDYVGDVLTGYAANIADNRELQPPVSLQAEALIAPLTPDGVRGETLIEDMQALLSAGYGMQIVRAATDLGNVEPVPVIEDSQCAPTNTDDYSELRLRLSRLTSIDYNRFIYGISLSLPPGVVYSPFSADQSTNWVIYDESFQPTQEFLDSLNAYFDWITCTLVDESETVTMPADVTLTTLRETFEATVPDAVVLASYEGYLQRRIAHFYTVTGVGILLDDNALFAAIPELNVDGCQVYTNPDGSDIILEPLAHFNTDGIDETQAEIDQFIERFTGEERYPDGFVFTEQGTVTEEFSALMSIVHDDLTCDFLIEQEEENRFNIYVDGTREGARYLLSRELLIAIVIGLSIIVGGGVVGGLQTTEVVDIRTVPNSGIRRSLRTATLVILAFGGVGILIGSLAGYALTQISVFIVPWSEATHSKILAISVVIGLTIGFGLGFLVGGIDAVIKHVILRVFLMRSGSIPLNYAKMLDESAERIILRKVGGGYIFIHRYLLEYFAKQDQFIKDQKMLDEDAYTATRLPEKPQND